MTKLIYILLFLMLAFGVMFIGLQKQRSQGMGDFTKDLESYKKQLSRKRDARVASPEARKAELIAQGWRLIDDGEYRQARNVARQILRTLDEEDEQAKSILSVAESILDR